MFDAAGRERLLTESVAAASDVRGEEWPRAVADQIAFRLHAAHASAWVLFAAVIFGPELVHVCTAGDLRVHQLDRFQHIAAVTRDHVLGEEEPAWIRQQYGDIAIEDHYSMVTRTLGGTSRDPVAVSWRRLPGDTLLVCSSAIHRNDEPDAYVGQIDARAEVLSVDDDLFVFELRP